MNSDEPDPRDVSALLDAVGEQEQRSRPERKGRVAETLRQLKELADQGLISHELYEAQAADFNRHFGSDLLASARRKEPWLLVGDALQKRNVDQGDLAVACVDSAHAPEFTDDFGDRLAHRTDGGG